MRSTIIVALFAVVVACIVCAGQASAYFELDEKLIGTAKRTVLPDGRIHYQLPTKHREPFPENVQFPKTDDGDVLDEVDKEHYITAHGHAIMPAHFEVFKLEDHTDVNKVVCHDKGDKNMRLSLFSVQPKLMEYLTNKKGSVILTANANQHNCHGDPIFRVVTDVKQFGDEFLLITDRAHYENIFEEADVNLEVKHPQLTHIDSERELPSYDTDSSDHGIYQRSPDEALNLPTEHIRATFGSKSIAENPDRMNEVDSSLANDLVERLAAEEQEDESGLTEQEKQVRRARKLGWFKKAFKKIKKAVKKVVKKVVKTVKKVVGKVVKAVAKGIKNIAKTIGNLLTFSFDKKFTKGISFKKNYVKPLYGVKFTFNFKFYAGFKFQLTIKYFKLKVFHTSVYGGFNLAGAAETPNLKYNKDGMTTLFTIKGPTITFSIGPVPVWIIVDVPILAGFELGAGFYAKAGFSASAYARLGVEYTSKNGFRVINERSFKKSHYLKYRAELHASPWIGAQCRFRLYSFVNGYAMVQVGLDVSLTTRNRRCNLIKINADLFMRVSAGVDITIKILGKKLVDKKAGPWILWKKSWPVINVCKRKKRRALLGLAASEAGLEAALPLPDVSHGEARDEAKMRSATALEVEKTTELDEDDSGKVWTTTVVCNSSLSYDFDVTGFFSNDSTLFYVSVSSNYTIPAGWDNANSVNRTWFNQTFVTVSQSSLAYINSSITLGMPATKAVLIEPNRTNAEELGIDWEDLLVLSQNASGDPNITAFSIPYITMTFGADDLAKLTMNSPWLCTPPNTNSITPPALQENTTEPAAPPEGTMIGRMFEALGKSLFPAFIRLITDALVAVLVLAVIEVALCWYGLPRWVGDHWPKQATTPRTREKVFLYISMSVGVLCFIVFMVGSNLVFSNIIGARLQQNYTAPAPKTNPDPASFLVASGVETIVWKFQGASITKRHCPQFYPCSPDCRDLCTSKTFSWTNAPWPYCPDTAIATNTGGCTKWAFDQIFNAIFAVFFITVGPLLAVYKSDTVYRRMPLMHASIMLSAMFLCLMWRRMHSFMKEVEVELFDPTTDMIIPFDLYFNEESVKTWEGACVVFFILAGIMGLACLVEMYLFYQDTVEGRIVKYDADFEQDLESAEGGKSSYKKSEEEVLGTSFAKNVMADLDGMNVQEASASNFAAHQA